MPRRAPRERKSPSPAPADPPADDPPPPDPEPAPEDTPADDPSPPADADASADAGDADPPAPADADADASPEKVRTCLRMTVSIRLAGYLIGHKGAHVKYVRDQTRCGIHVQDVSRSAPSDAMRCVVVTSSDPRDTDDGTGTGTGTPTRGRDALVRCWRRMTESALPSTAPPGTVGARPPDGDYAARLLVPASQMARLDPIAVVADPAVTVAVDERPADDPTLVSCALPNDRAVRISGPDESVCAAVGRLADALDYRVNPADPADDPLLIIKNPDVVADYFKDRALAKAKIRRGGYSDHATAVARGGASTTTSGKPWGRVVVGGDASRRERDAPSDQRREHGLRRALRGDEIMVEFDVDAVSAGGIIGKRGATIAEIRRRCDVLATVRTDAPKGAARTVEIVGKEPNAMRAKAEIEAKVREENPKYGRCSALRITGPGGTPRGGDRGDRRGFDRGYDSRYDRDRDRDRERYDDRSRGWGAGGADRGYDRDRDRGGYHPYGGGGGGGGGGGESRPARSYSARDYAPGRRSQGHDGGGYHQPPAREYEYGGGGGWGHGQHPAPARWDAGGDGYDRGGGYDTHAPRYDQGWQHQQHQGHAQYHQQAPPPQQQQQTYGAPAYQHHEQQQHAYGDPYHQQSYPSQQQPGGGYGGATQQQYRY